MRDALERGVDRDGLGSLACGLLGLVASITLNGALLLRGSWVVCTASWSGPDVLGVGLLLPLALSPTLGIASVVLGGRAVRRPSDRPPVLGAVGAALGGAGMLLGVLVHMADFRTPFVVVSPF